MCQYTAFILLKSRQEARFTVPGLHLHKNDVVNTACNRIEDRHLDGFAFTLVPSYTRPEMCIIGESTISSPQQSFVFNPRVLAEQIRKEITAVKHENHGDCRVCGAVGEGPTCGDCAENELEAHAERVLDMLDKYHEEHGTYGPGGLD